MPEMKTDSKSSYLIGIQTMGRGFHKNWNACVLLLAWKTWQSSPANKTSIAINGVQALAADDDGVQWRYMIRRQRDVCDAGHSND